MFFIYNYLLDKRLAAYLVLFLYKILYSYDIFPYSHFFKHYHPSLRSRFTFMINLIMLIRENYIKNTRGAIKMAEKNKLF